MKIPAIRGVIERRVLVNYRVDPAALQRVLPGDFRPLLVDGYGIGGICLIRLGQIRPAGVPGTWHTRETLYCSGIPEAGPAAAD